MDKSDWDRLIDRLVADGLLRSPKVIEAMRKVPRAEFIPPDMFSYASDDTPLPIGFGQTISAPHSLSYAELGETWFP